MGDPGERALRSLPVLYQTIDARVSDLERRHHGRLQCGAGCAQCCVDELTVNEVEAAHIREHVGKALRDAAPAPPGRCAFLDQDDRCRIYAVRPYVCRTQGLPLRWSKGEVEHRDICPLNEDGEPLETLPAEDCFTLGPVEQRLSLLQSLRSANHRVALRALFEDLSHPVELPRTKGAKAGDQ